MRSAMEAATHSSRTAWVAGSMGSPGMVGTGRRPAASGDGDHAQAVVRDEIPEQPAQEGALGGAQVAEELHLVLVRQGRQARDQGLARGGEHQRLVAPV